MTTENKQELAGMLFAEYTEADEEVERIKKLLEEANKRRSGMVQKVYTALGKGPFTYKGKYLGRIVIRGNTYFFRSGKDEVMDIK